jgi:AcrR family transcriptional regulator
MAAVRPASKAKTGPRWRRRSQARPEEILEAALAEFTERGFEAARMEDIAKAAGLSKAAIYLYFPSKMALLEALIETRVSPIAQQAQALAVAGAGDPVTTLKMLATGVAQRLGDPRVFAVPRLVIAVSGRFPEIAEFYRIHVIEKARAALEALIEAGKAKGVFRDVDTRAVTRAFIGPLFFEAMWTHVLRGESAFADPQKLIAQHFDILLNGLENRA